MKLSIELIGLIVGVFFWLASLNVKNAKAGRTLQAIATWIFLVVIVYKLLKMGGII